MPKAVGPVGAGGDEASLGRPGQRPAGGIPQVIALESPARQDRFDQSDVDRLSVMTRTSHRQLFATQTGSTRLRNQCLERLGGGSEIERPVDVAVRSDQFTAGRNHRHGTLVHRLDQSRTDLFGQHRVSGGTKGGVTQVGLVPGDDRTLELIEDG